MSAFGGKADISRTTSPSICPKWRYPKSTPLWGRQSGERVFALVGGAVVAWLHVARAQQCTLPVIGFMSRRPRVEAPRVENIALANFFGKQCDMRSKTMHEELIIVAHCHGLT